MSSGKQRGYVLISGLIFVVVLSLLGVSAMQTTSLEFKMSANTAYKKQAFGLAESGRAMMTGVRPDLKVTLEESLTQAGTWASLSTSLGLTVFDKDSSGSADNLAINGAGESIDNPVTDAALGIDLNNDGDASDANETVNVSAFNMKSIAGPGNGIGQFSGTLGLGKGASSGGTHVLFRIRSEGTGPSGARAAISTDYRHVTK